MEGASFDSTKLFLKDLLTNIHRGALQLPDFQRDWVWDDDRIRDLLASVSLSFPIGAIMLLETGGEHLRFQPRPLAGTPPACAETLPDTLILDGQQRLTALYLALFVTSAVETRDANGKKVRRWYYLDMRRAVSQNNDREEAVVSVPEDKLIRRFGGETVLDLSSREREFALGFFPVKEAFHSAEWRKAYYSFHNYNEEEIKLYDAFEDTVIKRFEQYQLPVIELKKKTPKEAVCLVFERVNTGGVSLTVFELLTATFAAQNYRLRDDWQAREKRLKTSFPVLASLQSDDFLQAVSLLVTHERRQRFIAAQGVSDAAPGIGCKRKDILKLEVSDWEDWADRVEKGFAATAKFLFGQKIFRASDLPYRTQLVTLAAAIVALDSDADRQSTKEKLARWYWCGVLGELYSGPYESRFARDLPEVLAWVRGEGGEPTTVQEAMFQPARLFSLRSRLSAAYKGLYALLIREKGCPDLLTGEPLEQQRFFDELVDVHHVFPEAWCKQHRIAADWYNSIVNKTLLSARTNRRIGSRQPSVYLPALERASGITPEKMDDNLRRHCIEPKYLRSDQFREFFAARAEALLQLIEAAMGKAIPRQSALFLSSWSSVGEADPAEELVARELAELLQS